MPDLSQLSAANFVANLVFSSIGFVAFIYGKKQNLWKPMFTGLALMVVPYFIASTALLVAAGACGTAVLFLFRE